MPFNTYSFPGSREFMPALSPKGNRRRRGARRRSAARTELRWHAELAEVQRYAPEFEKRWRRFARAVDRSWRVDETYVKIRGEWRYLYRAVDRAGRTADFRLSPRRDVAARQGVLS